MDVSFLSSKERLIIANSFLNSRRQLKRTATNYEIETILKWAERTRLRELLVDMVLDGEIQLDLIAGEEVVFAATDKLSQRLQASLETAIKPKGCSHGHSRRKKRA